jgi:CRP/FNR family transcriptional activator FtrB
MQESDRRLFEQTDLCRQVDPTVVQRLTQDCCVRSYGRGAVLAREGAAADGVYLILSGRVALTAACDGAPGTVIATFGDGEMFVCAAAILQLPYLVAARTTAESRILCIPAGRFRTALELEPSLALMVNRMLALHWRVLVDHLRQIKLHSAIERLAHYLLRRCPDGEMRTSLQLADDRRTIAAELGMSPELLSRLFGQLRDHGIEARGRRVSIGSIAALKALCRVPAAAVETGEKAPA